MKIESESNVLELDYLNKGLINGLNEWIDGYRLGDLK